MTECPQCGLKLSEQPSECPNCGYLFPSAEPASAPGLIKQFFGEIWLILTHPSAFFRKMPLGGGFTYPLAFALVTHWIGSALSFLWHSAVGGAMSNYFGGLLKMAGDVSDIDNPGRNAQLIEMKEKILHWFWGAGSVIADPFLTLASILFTSFLVFLGARILVTPGKNGAPREITFESALRIICFGLTPSILDAIPFFGGIVSSICIAIVTIVGAREVYRVGTGRATVVALFPKVLLLGVFFVGFAAFAVVVLKMVTSFF